MMRFSGTLHPWASAPKSARIRSHGEGRVCAHAGCDTVLSIYNPSSWCGVHSLDDTKRRSRWVERLAREGSCERCGMAFETTNATRKYCSDRCRMAAYARRKRAQPLLQRRVVQ